IEITIEGRGGHGASPHLSIDPVLVAAQFVVTVQQVVSRQIDPVEPAVVTIGAIEGGTTHNVIPSRVRLLGTVRAFDSEVRARMSERIERVLRGACEGCGATYAFEYLWRYPVTSNDPDQTRYVRSLAEHVAGPDRVAEVPRLMGAEDFSFFAERVPTCFFTIGCNGGPASAFPHHHARFDIDERALQQGVRMMTALALDAPLHAP
ncbi:MAG: amidohydrolase, partial [Candidatus Eremiobacteraeota bacterium]|nr:amidohydrolase [Candidatus Eremiobacteraeota bacterium]